MKDFYSFFGVSPSATPKEISVAFRKLALKYHPDKTGNRSTELFQQLNEAYETLSNPVKKIDYDRIWYSKNSKKVPPELISGVIASELIPDSYPYQEKRKSILMGLRQEPLTAKTLFDKNTDHAQIFDTIRARKNDVHVEKQFNGNPLTPKTALELLIAFLKGDYWGDQLLYIQDYLTNSIAEANQNLYESPNLNLYHGVLGILNIVADDTLRDNLNHYITQIIDFANQQAQFKDTRLLSLTTTLFQMKNFRELNIEGLRYYWQTPVDLELKSLFTSAIDQKIENGDTRYQTPKISQCYAAQCDLNTALTARSLTPGHLHDMAYKVLDYIKSLYLQNWVEALNHHLIAAKLYYVSSTLQVDELEKMADECMALSLLSSVCNQAKRPQPFNTFYIYNAALKLMNNFNYVHPGLAQTIKSIEQQAVRLADFFPCHDQLQSNIDLTISQVHQASLMRDYLSTLLDYFETDTPLEVPLIPLVYFAYEALFGNWLHRENKKEKMMQLREWLMDNLLEEKEWGYRNISDFLLHETATIARDEQGWMLPQAPLPFMKDLTLYQSFNGFQIDSKSGTINFSMTPFNADSNTQSPLFTDLDVAEIFNLAPSSIYYSLDPETADYLCHPFIKQTFRPNFLELGQMINTPRDVDLLLKFLNSGVEVRGCYPYDFRSASSIIAHLPDHLQKIITDYWQKNHSKSVEAQRFWFECQELPILHDEAGAETTQSVSMTFGTARFILKSQKMQFDSSGNLQDATQKEKSWTLYKMDNEQQAREQHRKGLLKVPAIVYCNASNHFYFVRGLHFLAKPVSIELPSSYLKVMLELRVNDNYQIMATGTPYQVSSTHEFFYQFIKQVTEKAKEPHLFSPERVFAEEFTAHMSEFAEHFPIIARLEQLTRIIVAADQLKRYQRDNNKSMVAIEARLQDSYWVDETNRLIELNKINVHPLISSMQNNLSNDANQILQNVSEKIESIIKEVPIGDEESFVTAARMSLRTNFAHLATHSGKPHLDQFIELFLKGEIEPLTNAERNYQWQEYCKVVRAHLITQFLPESVDAFLNGNIEPIKLFIATQATKEMITAQQLEFTEEKRNEFKSALASQRIMARQFDKLGLGKDNPENSSASGCSWLPASHSHPEIVESSTIGCGGVRIGALPVLGPQAVYRRINAANQLTSNLIFPPTSVFGPWKDVKDAKQFLSDVNGTVLNPDLMNAVSRLNVEVWHAEQELQRRQQERDFKNRAQDQKNFFFPEKKPDETDRGFRHRGIDKLPAIEVFNGNTGDSGFNYRRSDSAECTFWKTQYNDNIASQNTAKYSHPLSFFARQTLLQKILDGINAECKGPTDEDKINEAKGEKYLHELTPKELIELSQMHMKDATRFFSNWFEKRRLKDRTHPWPIYHKL